MRRAAACLLILIGVLAGSAPGALAVDLPAPERELSYLSVGPAAASSNGLPQITDAHGRVVLLKGVNVDGLVDYYRSDLRTPYPSDAASYDGGRCPPDDPNVEGVRLCDFDLPQMRPLGYDSIRLNISWSLLEPQPGQISQPYLERIAQVVGWARAQGIYVILDVHQDAWSKYVYSRPSDPCAPPFKATRGYDGAPLWASDHVSPACALNGVRELDPAVQEDFQRLYSDAPAPDGVGLQEHYASVFVALARRFKGEPAVAGYEIINEPSPGFNPAPGGMDATELFPFYGKVVGSVVRSVPGFRQLFFIEPNTSRDVTDQSAIVTPWSAYSSYPNVVYAPHIYTGVFTLDQEVASQRFFPTDGGYRSAIQDATALGLPLWVGEFGNNPQDDSTILRSHYDLQDRYLLGGALWLWKENSNDVNGAVFWGVFGPPFGEGTPQPARVRLTARAFPLFTAGRLENLAYDSGSGSFDMRAQSPRVRCGDRAAATVVFVPPSVRGLAVEGAQVQTFQRADGAREAYVYPNGGAYRVHTASTGPEPAFCSAASRGGGSRGGGANPLGLPQRGSCVDRRRFRFRLHQPRGGSIVRADVYLNGRRIQRLRAGRVLRVAMTALPPGHFAVRIVAVTNRGVRVTSRRIYNGCRKGHPRTRVRHRRGRRGPTLTG